MKDAHKALLDVVKSSTYPHEVRAGAAEGLGFHGGPDVQKALIDVAKSSTYPHEVRAAAAKAAGRISNE